MAGVWSKPAIPGDASLREKGGRRKKVIIKNHPATLEVNAKN